MNRRLRVSLAIVLICLTAAAFGYYINHNRYLLTQLAHTHASTLIWLILLYAAWFIALCLIVWASIRICQKSLDTKEGFLLNAYSTLVNFFVPGQGGIVVRGAYLKRIKKLKVRNYIYVTLIYYMFYAVIACVLLLAASRPLWQTLGSAIIVGVISLVIIHLFTSRSHLQTSELAITKTNLSYLIGATLLQAIIQVAIYGVELHSVNQHISLSQIITYTGAANFALFVALTPGAIGIREAFLLFTRHLHHISSANIVAANVIDRAIFIVVLGILFVITLGFHAKYKSLWNKPDVENQASDKSIGSNY
jgi:uncharacterized membrane protein YbhN (UPF0104 family)